MGKFVLNSFLNLVLCAMDIDDLFVNSDWDPVYLAVIFLEDFNDMSDL